MGIAENAEQKMGEKTSLKHGSFTGLAENYSKYRPSYSNDVLNAILGITGKPVNEIDFVDVGAGTGIWTRLVADKGVASGIAIEPNDEMRGFGEKDSADKKIDWRNGAGEQTGLKDSSADLVSMASSFHWVDFDLGTKEFNRILRPGGHFTALWNPRHIEANPLLVEIEDALYDMVPHLKRFSSGRSGLGEVLTQKLTESPYFENVTYLEGYHLSKQTPEEYLGVWWSVNDIRVQAGEELFKRFMQYVEERTKGMDFIETTYQTRAWIAQSVK